jgi:phenylacetate-coenzyme A ligase PaaK-like adenylate-forming protein
MQPPLDLWFSEVIAADVATAAAATPAGIAERRNRRISALLESAIHRSPFYRRLLKARRAAPCLADMPVVRKPELMGRFDGWCTDPAIRLGGARRFLADASKLGEPFLDKYLLWESSGTSGEPGIFVQDAAALAVYDALELLRRPDSFSRLISLWTVAEKIVFVGATGGHFASNVSIERLRRLNPWMANRIASVSFLLPVHELLQEIGRHAPAVIATYPSVAALLAGEFLAGRLRTAPREIWTGGETLSLELRTFIEQSLGCRVRNSYGTSEFLTLASECPHGALHFNNDWAVLEPIDARGRPVPPGTEAATTLLTNLANHVQPVIRYDLGDQVTIHAAPCACGSPLPVVDVHGRSDDTLVVRGDRGQRVSLVPLAITTVLEERAGLFDFQIVQQGDGELSLSTPEAGSVATRRLRRARDVLDTYLCEQGAHHVRIHCCSGQSSRRGRSGKLQRVVAKQH